MTNEQDGLNGITYRSNKARFGVTYYKSAGAETCLEGFEEWAFEKGLVEGSCEYNLSHMGWQASHNQLSDFFGQLKKANYELYKEINGLEFEKTGLVVENGRLRKALEFTVYKLNTLFELHGYKHPQDARDFEKAKEALEIEYES